MKQILLDAKKVGKQLYQAKLEGFWSALMAILLVLWNVGGWSKEDLESLIDRVLDLSYALKNRDEATVQLIKDFTEDTGIVLNVADLNDRAWGLHNQLQVGWFKSRWEGDD